LPEFEGGPKWGGGRWQPENGWAPPRCPSSNARWIMCVGWVGDWPGVKFTRSPKGMRCGYNAGRGNGEKGEMSEMKGLKPYEGSLSFEKWASK
jgi:hypothetical protein